MKLTRRTLLAQSLAMPFVLSGISNAAPTTPSKLWENVDTPVGMGFDAQGNLFIAEWGAGRISRFSTNGKREVFAENLPGPSGLAVSPDGEIFVASYSSDLIWRFTPSGTRSTYVTGLATPAGLSFDRTGRLMVANRRTNEILRIDTGKPTPIIDKLNTPVGVVQTSDDGYVVSNIAGGVTILRPDGTRIDAGQDFQTPGPGITLTENGRVFVVDYGGTVVREILLEGESKIFADGLKSPVGLLVTPDESAVLTATWGDRAVFRIPLNA